MDIMQAIMEIEKTARGIADSAVEMQKSHEAALQEEIARREAAAHQEAKAQLEQVLLRVNAERQEKIEALESAYQEKLEALDSRCKASQSAWVAEITKAVLDA